jgi:release factor glutamine methyltransferase
MKSIQAIRQKYYKKIDLLDLELIISRVIKKPREFVLAHPEYKIIKNYELRIKNYVNRRIKNEPLAYIFGCKEFYGLNFKVNKNTLIPRPETELMVDEALKLRQQTTGNRQQDILFIDVGAGSGCVIVSIIKNLINSKFKIQDSRFFASDISEPALRVARQNAKLHGVNKKIKFLHGNLLEPAVEIIKNKKLKIENCKLIIVSNLPYLTPTQIKNSPSIQYEPRIALDAGKDGLKYYRRLFKQIKKMLNSLEFTKNSRIFAIIEIDPAQTAKIKKIIKNNLPAAKIKTKKDLRGLNRIVIAEI